MRARNSILLAVMRLPSAPACPPLRRKPKPLCGTAFRWRIIPLTHGPAGSGRRRLSVQRLYDLRSLVAWEMDVSDRPGKLVPGLATEWKVDDNDKTKWRFKLRQGVKFHDGSDFNADAVDLESGTRVGLENGTRAPTGPIPGKTQGRAPEPAAKKLKKKNPGLAGRVAPRPF